MRALALVLEGRDLTLLGGGVGLTALGVGGAGGRAVLDEDLRPGVEEGNTAAVSFPEIGTRDLVEKMLSEHGAFLLAREVTALPVQGSSSARGLPLTLPKANSCFDRGKTQ